MIVFDNIVLIRKESMKTVEEFRPISLLNSSINIVSKVLADRLVALLENLVGDYRLCFIKDHNILEGIATTQKLFIKLRRKK